MDVRYGRHHVPPSSVVAPVKGSKKGYAVMIMPRRVFGEPSCTCSVGVTAVDIGQISKLPVVPNARSRPPQQSAGVTDAALTTVFKSDVMLLQLKFEKLERLWGTSAKSYEPHVNAPPEAVVSIEPHGKEEALRAHIQKLQCELAHTATDLQTKHRVAENRWHRELEVLKHECAALNNTIMGLHEEVDVTKRALRHTTQELETASLKLELLQHECQRHDTTMKTLVGENEEMVNQLRDRHATATAHWTAELDGIHRRFQTQLDEVHAQQRAQKQQSDERHATQLQRALDKVATLEDSTYELKGLVTTLTEEDDALVQRIEHWYCVVNLAEHDMVTVRM
ncbi:hypothetical protein DYB25_012386 [Aphanomyces astaci]|uniref:Uncharacterized protein n=1 Tax=Aphanomyces astaci TaxID=112090 RepID=A0A397AIK3_APHAT|nr:hypothetical protein DYB25_012386 [Aphanomyces astaci]